MGRCQDRSLAINQLARNANNTTHKDISPLHLELNQTIKHLTAAHQPKLLPSRATFYHPNHQKKTSKSLTGSKIVAQHEVLKRLLQARAQTVQRLQSFFRD